METDITGLFEEHHAAQHSSVNVGSMQDLCPTQQSNKAIFVDTVVCIYSCSDHCLGYYSFIVQTNLFFAAANITMC